MAGFIGAIVDADSFVAQQVPLETQLTYSANSRAVAWQLGNLYLLLAMIGLAVLNTTSEVKVVRSYLVALWVADIGHIAACYFALGQANFMDLGSWNAMTWGNVAVTVSSDEFRCIVTYFSLSWRQQLRTCASSSCA